ncbi:type VII secretion-associated serine protease mycosin [Streptomyces sp. NBC_00233]|uniref:type VII secretion-associated serine protease mycosin n=1 Tax=Streptomyces sp. NBC_00233 TaxID=2975686 RepID=UPI002258F1AE|nr:type VII secretion-associated serine protease mycosin [Streptomyces sp. NBC_00233]MCX5226508.1 type VII secretion-associated serine protease mycosin [Streptomyces sp. NBC_00233]
MLLVGIASVPAHAEGIRDRQWHLTAMGAEEIWQLSTGKGVTVAVIDSGVEKQNPDLPGQVLKGKNLAPGEAGDEFTDYTGHGTNMAGLIAGTGKANGGQGAYGLAPGAKILPVRVPGSGGGKGSQAAADREFNAVMPEAIRFAVDSGAKVVNISQGSQAGSQRLTDAVKYALDKGALVFASVGNSGDKSNKLEYPGATPGVVGVGAIDQKLKRLPLSQFGPQVDIVAAGKDTVAACGGGRVCTSSGTSNATALASATAALIWSKHPDWTNNQVLKVMLNTISPPTEGPQRSDYIGYGAIRPLRALKTPGDPGPADVRPIDDLSETVTPSASASADPAPAESSVAPAPAPAVTQAASEDGGNTGLWIGLGIGAAVLIGAAVAVSVLRSRRS